MSDSTSPMSIWGELLSTTPSRISPADDDESEEEDDAEFPAPGEDDETPLVIASCPFAMCPTIEGRCVIVVPMTIADERMARNWGISIGI